MSAECLLKSFGVRFTVQRFAAWLETIRGSVDIFRQRGEYTVEERGKSLNLADAAIDDCVNAVEVELADNFRTIGGHDPRDWFAMTLTTAKKLQLRLRTLHDVLSERPDAWLTETQQKELESLGSELRDRANLLDSAALTLPPSAGASCPNEMPNTSKPVQQPLDLKNERDAIVKTFPLAFLRSADPQSVDLLAYLLQVGLTTRDDVFRDFWKDKAVTIDAPRKALKRLDDDILALARDDFELVNRSHAVWVERLDKIRTKTD